MLEKARAARREAKAEAREAKVNGSPAPAEVAAKPERVNLVQLKKQIQVFDRQMRELQDKIGILDKALEDPQLYSTDPKKAADFARLRTRLADDLETAELNWLEAHETYEAAGGV